MVSVFPLRVYDWPLSDFDDAVTRGQASFPRSVDEIYVCPLIAMVVNVIRELTKQDAFWFQHAVSFAHEGWERVRERIVILFR